MRKRGSRHPRTRLHQVLSTIDIRFVGRALYLLNLRSREHTMTLGAQRVPEMSAQNYVLGQKSRFGGQRRGFPAGEHNPTVHRHGGVADPTLVWRNARKNKFLALLRPKSPQLNTDQHTQAEQFLSFYVDQRDMTPSPCVAIRASSPCDRGCLAQPATVEIRSWRFLTIHSQGCDHMNFNFQEKCYY